MGQQAGPVARTSRRSSRAARGSIASGPAGPPLVSGPGPCPPAVPPGRRRGRCPRAQQRLEPSFPALSPRPGPTAGAAPLFGRRPEAGAPCAPRGGTGRRRGLTRSQGCSSERVSGGSELLTPTQPEHRVLFCLWAFSPRSFRDQRAEKNPSADMDHEKRLVREKIAPLGVAEGRSASTNHSDGRARFFFLPRPADSGISISSNDRSVHRGP